MLDDTHGVFRIASPMATFNVDKQNDLKQLSQMGTGGRVTIAIEDIQRDGRLLCRPLCRILISLTGYADGCRHDVDGGDGGVQPRQEHACRKPRKPAALASRPAHAWFADTMAAGFQARAGSIRQFAANIDSHGQTALQGESFYDQRRAATPPRCAFTALAQSFLPCLMPLLAAAGGTERAVAALLKVWVYRTMKRMCITVCEYMTWNHNK